MSWVETESLSFTARHDSGDAAFADRTLDRMETLHTMSRQSRQAFQGADTELASQLTKSGSPAAKR